MVRVLEAVDAVRVDVGAVEVVVREGVTVTLAARVGVVDEDIVVASLLRAGELTEVVTLRVDAAGDVSTVRDVVVAVVRDPVDVAAGVLERLEVDAAVVVPRVEEAGAMALVPAVVVDADEGTLVRDDVPVDEVREEAPVSAEAVIDMSRVLVLPALRTTNEP